MGCICCSLGALVSRALDAIERASMCIVCASLICCLLFTVTFILVVGIGIGYNYSAVQTHLDAMDEAAKGFNVVSAPGVEDSRPYVSVNSADDDGTKRMSFRKKKRDLHLVSASNYADAPHNSTLPFLRKIHKDLSALS